MTERVKSLEQGVIGLTESEFKQFAKWFWDLNDKRWLAQMERDAESGALDFLIEKARSERESGKLREI